MSAELFNICRKDGDTVAVINRARGEGEALTLRDHYYNLAKARGSSARFFIKALPDAIARHLPDARRHAEAYFAAPRKV